MRFTITRLERPVDTTDLSDLTTAQRTGPASWVAEGVLEIPFDRALTPNEVTLITRRLTTPDADTETLVGLLASALTGNDAFLALSSPTTAQAVAQVQALTRQVSALLRRAAGPLAD